MKISRTKLEQFIAEHASDKKALDVGARRGRYNNLFPNKISIDIDEESNPDIVADAHNLPFEENTFEIILCTEVLEHVDNPFKVAKELHRVLKPGGKLILTTRFMYPLHEAPRDNWRFTVFNLRSLFSEFNEVEVLAETDSITTFASLFQRLVWQTRFRGNYFWQIFFRIVTWLLLRFTWIVKEQYGDVTKNYKVDTAFTTGYHVIALK